MIRVLLPVTALVAFALTACIDERPYASPTQYATDVNSSGAPDGSSTINVSKGRVFGDFGSVTNFDRPTDSIDAWYDPSWKSTSITLTATDESDRMGMFILNVDGVDLRTVRPGAYTFTTQSVDPSIGGDGYVSVTGCSSSPDSYYDEPGDTGTITVQDTPDGRQVSVDSSLPAVDGAGNYTSGNTAAHGSFTLQ